MKTNTYYEVVENSTLGSLLLDNPLHETEKVRWQRFKSLENAKRRIEKSKQSRKNQYFYFRDSEGKIIDKMSFYERYNVEYKIYKIVEQKEMIYKTSNDDVKIREPKEHTQEETTL